MVLVAEGCVHIYCAWAFLSLLLSGVSELHYMHA